MWSRFWRFLARFGLAQNPTSHRWFLSPVCILFVVLTASCPFGVITGHAQASFILSSDWQLQNTGSVTDPGSVISQPNYQPVGWYQAAVPGTVLTTLVNDGVYPEPLYGTNNDNIPDGLCLASYWYRTTFVVPSSFSGNRTWLNFHGINYTATVWVNGVNVGSIQGAFTRGTFDITSVADIGGTNGLAVLIQPEPNPGTATEQTQAGGTGGNGGVTAIDGPTFLSTIGWDWIPTIHDRDSGIWQGVTVSSSGPVVIQNPYVTSQLPLPGRATANLTISATVSNATTTAQSGILSGTIDGTNTFQQNVSLSANGTQTVTFNTTNTPSLCLTNPLLWWPNGYGAPNLHTLQLSLSIGEGVSDSQTVTFGIRQITYTLPATGSNLAISVNGVPVMCKGGDWGMDEAMKRIPANRLQAEIQYHQLANLDIIRNWVGQSTSDEFYNLCDQYGIMVWDEFFQPYPGDGPNPTNTVLYLANVQDTILRLRNHPSVVLWCGRNEGMPAPTAIAQSITNLLATLDPRRFYQTNSASGIGLSDGPYYWQDPSSFYSFGDSFHTEEGAPSIPTLESVEGMMPSNDWQIIDNDWAEHDFCSGAQDGNQYPGIMANRYGLISSLADFVRKGQLMNYEEVRAMYEGRFSELFNPATGFIYWLSNPAHPSFVWQFYSWDLEPNACLFAAQKACEPIHIQLDQSNWHLMVINNTPQTLSSMTAVLQVYNLDSSMPYAQTNTLVTAAPSAATDLGLVSFPAAGLSAVHFVKLKLFDSQSNLLSDNFYWRETVTDDFQALDSLPMVTLNVQATNQTVGSNCVISAMLVNHSTNIAVMSHIQLRGAANNQRVLPVFYSDNYISLLPGESHSVTITVQTNYLNGQAPMLAVDGWNVTVIPSAASGDYIVITNNLPAAANSGIITDPISVYRINCGGPSSDYFTTVFLQFGPPYSDPGFAQDHYFNGGTTFSTGNIVDTDVPNAAPEIVYQSERHGSGSTFNYTFPMTAGPANYTVRLHFVETALASVGARIFNVAINSQTVLTNFDIFAVGGSNTAVVETFTNVWPDSNTNIVISFIPGPVNNPKIDGIEIFPTHGRSTSQQATNVIVNFDVPGGPTDGVGAVNSSGYANYYGQGALADPGNNFWNPVVRNGTTPAGQLNDDGETVSPITLTSADNGAYSSSAQGPNGLPHALEDFYLYAKPGIVTNSLNNVPAGTYNIFLYGKNASYADRGSIFTVWTTNGGMHSFGSLSTSNSGMVNLSFVLGDDYVEFTNVALTTNVTGGNGTIFFSYTASPNTLTADNTEGDYNGLQLQEVSLTDALQAPIPAITKIAGGGGLMIAWPTASGASWTLYQTTNLTPPVIWFPVTNAIVTVNGSNRINLAPNAGARFFRLEN